MVSMTTESLTTTSPACTFNEINHLSSSSLDVPTYEQFEANRFTFHVTNISHILSSKDRDKWSADLGIPLPDILFGESKIAIMFNDNAVIQWSTMDILKGIKKGSWPTYTSSPLEPVEIAAAKEWRRHGLYRPTLHSSIDNFSIVSGHSPIESESSSDSILYVHGCTVAPHDWTFTSSLYHGTLDSRIVSVNFMHGSIFDEFDKDMLLRHDPIQYSKYIVFYEDELGDHGTSIFTVRLRIMPNCFLLLARSYVKLQDVLIRAIETRIMGKLDHGPLYRDISTKEIAWVSDEKLFEALGCASREVWQQLQSDEDAICSRLPIVSTRSERLDIHISGHVQDT